MPGKFLTRNELYRLLQRELPEGVYPDGAPSAFYSTADMDSIAGVLATAYENLERIDANNFPQTADERIASWVEKMFIGASFDSSVTLQDLRDRVIAKVRKQPKINLWEVLILVASYVPPGVYVQVVEECGDGKNVWALGESKLGVETYLRGFKHWHEYGFSNAEYCNVIKDLGWRLGENKIGDDTKLSDVYGPDLYDSQFSFYGYTIRVFNYQITGTSLEQLKRQLSDTAPARSPEMIIQNLNPADYALTNVVTDVDETSGVNCITIDNLSSTGYSGLTT
jgi:hypothetical protein